MSINYGFNKYKQTSVTTASRGRILLMLYESAIKHTRLAIEALQKKNLSEKGRNILKIQDIINELSLSLDHDVNSAVSKELDRLYTFVIDQITEANIKNEIKPLQSVLHVLETLYQGWQGAVQQVEKGKPEAKNLEEKNTDPSVSKDQLK